MSAGIQDTVAIETPRGNVRSGTVVDTEWDASVATLQRLLVVDVDGVTICVPESDAEPR